MSFFYLAPENTPSAVSVQRADRSLAWAVPYEPDEQTRAVVQAEMTWFHVVFRRGEACESHQDSYRSQQETCRTEAIPSDRVVVKNGHFGGFLRSQTCNLWPDTFIEVGGEPVKISGESFTRCLEGRYAYTFTSTETVQIVFKAEETETL